MSKKLFPQIAHSTVADSIRSTPYLNLQWLFLDLSALANQVSEAGTYVPLGEEFETWNSDRDKNFEKRLGLEPSDDLFHILDRYSDYVLGLDASEFKADHLKILFTHLQKYIEKDLITHQGAFSGTSLSSLLIAPALKWDGAACEVGSELVEVLENILLVICAELRKSYSSDVLSLQNWLFFTYIAIAQLAKIGINAAVCSRVVQVFRSVSPSKWAATRTDVRVQYAALMLSFTLHFYELDEPFKTKHGFSQGMLAELRSIFQDAGNTTLEAGFTPAQWVFRWFVDKLDAEVFTSQRRNEISGLSALSPVEHNLAVELTRRFAGYRVPVSVDSLAGFLLQFGTTQRIRGALRLLMNIKFYPLWELSQAIEKTLAEELKRTGGEHLVISAFGEHTGSAAIMNYLVAHSPLARSLKFEPNLTSALSVTAADDSIYIVDDCLLSGTQGLNTLGDLMGTRPRKSHHTIHAQELSCEDKKRLKNRHLKFTYGVVMDLGMRRFHGADYDKTGLDKDRAGILYGAIETASSKIFEPLGPVNWLSKEERDEMKYFCEEVGYNILERRAKEKKWDDERRTESALGFSDMQRLLVFPYNVPKTTLTLLWEGSTGDFNWRPLFPGFD